MRTTYLETSLIWISFFNDEYISSYDKQEVWIHNSWKRRGAFGIFNDANEIPYWDQFWERELKEERRKEIERIKREMRKQKRRQNV